jgi:hypothetical protein
MKSKLLLALLLISSFAYSQPGNLVPDSQHTRNDTLRGNIVWVDSNAVVKSSKEGILIRIFAPMVFKGANGAVVSTNQVSIIGYKYYVRKEEIDAQTVIYFKYNNK